MDDAITKIKEYFLDVEIFKLITLTGGTTNQMILAHTSKGSFVVRYFAKNKIVDRDTEHLLSLHLCSYGLYKQIYYHFEVRSYY